MKAFFGFRGERSELMVVSFGKLLDTSENGLSDIHNFSHSSGLFIFVDFFCSFSLLRPKGCGHSHNGVDQGQVQSGGRLLQQDLETLDHIYEDLLPEVDPVLF